MNDIIFAGGNDNFGTSKNFEIIVPEKGDVITVVPPLTKNSSDGGLRITLDKALLPFREITEVSDNGDIRHAAERAAYYFRSDFPKKQAVLSALGGLLVSLITALAGRTEFSPVVEIIRADVAKSVSDCAYSVEDTLRRLPLNYDYVRKLFTKEVGVTPREYLLRARMELASGIIRSGITNKYSGYTVSQTAEACGFSDPLYFSRVFKKYFGVSPSEYK